MFKKLFFISALSLILVFAFTSPILAQTTWQNPVDEPPDCTDGDIPGCNPPINTSASGQTKLGALIVGGLRSLIDLIVDGNVFVGDSAVRSTEDSSNPAITVAGPSNPIIDIQAPVNTNSAIRFTKGGDSYWYISNRGSNDPHAPNGLVFWRMIGKEQANAAWRDLTINQTGNVGVGVPSPQSKLDVGGDICYTVNGTRKCLSTGGSGGDGIGSSVLSTKFSNCVALLGCTSRSGDAGPTQSINSTLGGGYIEMSCPAGYKVVTGGVQCEPSIKVGSFVKYGFINDSEPIGTTGWRVQCSQIWTQSLGIIVLGTTVNGIKDASIVCAK